MGTGLIVVDINAFRMVIKNSSFNENNIDKEFATELPLSRNYIHGISGSLAWKKIVIVTEVSQHQICFATHSISARQGLGPDTVPLSTLF
jgi:hypothetical protein